MMSANQLGGGLGLSAYSSPFVLALWIRRDGAENAQWGRAALESRLNASRDDICAVVGLLRVWGFSLLLIIQFALSRRGLKACSIGDEGYPSVRIN